MRTRRWRQIVEVFVAAGRGLASAHTARLAHRDLSLHTRMTRTGALLGTPAYLAPEQIATHTSSAASDQFAFCVALHEALVGLRPFAGDHFAIPAHRCPWARIDAR